MVHFIQVKKKTKMNEEAVEFRNPVYKSPKKPSLLPKHTDNCIFKPDELEMQKIDIFFKMYSSDGKFSAKKIQIFCENFGNSFEANDEELEKQVDTAKSLFESTNTNESDEINYEQFLIFVKQFLFENNSFSELDKK